MLAALHEHLTVDDGAGVDLLGEARLEQLRSPFPTAEAFWIEATVDPPDTHTRGLLCEFANLSVPLRTPGVAAFTMRP